MKQALKRIGISGSSVAIVALIYVFIALVPYMGRAYVSAEVRNTFTVDKFFGDYTSPERVMLLEAPNDAFFHRVNLISNAKEQIIFSSFAIYEGISGDIIIGALLSAADRGVDIQILYNAIGGGMRSRYRNVLAAHDNINVYSFSRWEFFRPWHLNSAMHDKYMVVDGTFMILGGRNISDRYFAPDGFSGNLTYDREILVYNTNSEFNGSIADVLDYFYVKINSSRAHLHSRATAGSDWEVRKDVHIIQYQLYRQSLNSNNFNYYENTVATNGITLITNPIGTTKNDSVVAFSLMMLTQNSNVIVAQSPYVAFTHRNMRLFTELVEDRDFTLVTNSLASAVNLPAFSSYYVSRGRLINAGITIYEFQSTDSSIHGKTYLFDGRLTAIGSFNMNERSIRSDTESMLVIDSEEFHNIVLDAIGDQIAQSLMVDIDRNYVLSDYVEEAHASWGKRVLYIAAGTVLRLFRFMF